MQASVYFDTSALEAAQDRLLEAIKERSIPTVAESTKRRIKGLTAEGADAFGQIFHAYSDSQRKKREAQGYQTDVKDLRMGEGRLYEMELVGDTLTFTDDKAKKIAHGQMYHPKWRWHNHFFDLSQDGADVAGDELVRVLEGAIT